MSVAELAAVYSMSEKTTGELDLPFRAQSSSGAQFTNSASGAQFNNSASGTQNNNTGAGNQFNFSGSGHPTISLGQTNLEPRQFRMNR